MTARRKEEEHAARLRQDERRQTNLGKTSLLLKGSVEPSKRHRLGNLIRVKDKPGPP